MKKLLIIALLLGAAAYSNASPVMLKTGTLHPPSKTQASLPLAVTAASGGYYLIQFESTPRSEWKVAISDMGITLGEYIPENTYTVRLTSSQLAKVHRLEFVRWIGRLQPSYKISPELAKLKTGRLEVMIRLFKGESPEALLKLLKSYRSIIARDAGVSGVIHAEVPAGALGRIAALEEVVWIEPWEQPRVTNNVAATITNITDMRQRVGLYGQGQVIAFGDSGLDTGNLNTISPDFAGRIFKTYGIRRPGEWSDLSGHGTHAIGTAAGAGVNSGAVPASQNYDGSFAGAAPESQIIIQSIGDSSAFVYPPAQLATMFQPAYDDGARIHNNSWGSPSAGGSYTTYSQQVDDFCWNHRDFVVVFPVGNDGRDGNNDGVTDLGSVYTPATAKNCISVGASESVRTTGLQSTYGLRWPGDFNAPPLSNDNISNNASGMAAWSGRGPCKDGRIKPDIVAPGTNIVSNRTQATPTVYNWAVWELDPAKYMYLGGTSMSTPLVSGAAALIRQNYQTQYGLNPSSALVKATLLNGAFDMTPGQYATTEIPPRPNSVQGWGRLDMNASLQPAAPRVIEFVDDSIGVATGDIRQYQYQVLGNGERLSVTLVWTDPPASLLSSKQLVNDLNLKVTAPGNVNYYGNGIVDNTNNVEQVDIPSPAPGVYTVTVTALSVPEGPQPFALVVSGELPQNYIAGRVLTPSGNPVPGVTITATGGSVNKSTQTGNDGRYTLHLQDGSFTVTPSKTGWTFNPLNQNVSLSGSQVTGVNFTGSAAAASVSGTVNASIGGVTGYSLDSPHPFYQFTDQTYAISGHPNVTEMRVHFSELEVQTGFDYVYIMDGDNNIYEILTGIYSDYWSQWVPGNVIKIRLEASNSRFGNWLDYGFHIDAYETDVIALGPVQGVTVTASPSGYSAITGPNGSYTISGLEPIPHIIKPEYGQYTFSPIEKTVFPTPGQALAGTDFKALPPAVISGTVTKGNVTTTPVDVYCPHPYSENERLTEVVTGPPGSTRIRVHFTSIETEAEYDFLWVCDADGNRIDTFHGSYTDVWSSWIPGNTLKIQLFSDESYSLDGFRTDKIETVSGEYGVKGVDITLQPGGMSVTTQSDGSYVFPAVKAGLYSLMPAKPFWAFNPASREVIAAPGINTSGVGFFGTLAGVMPSIGYIKTLEDNEEVVLSQKVVTAGTGQMGGSFYIEEMNQSAAIKVVTGQTVNEGDLVNVSGALTTSGNERFINAPSGSVTVLSSGNPLPNLLKFRLSDIAGGALNEHTPGVHNDEQIHSIGLLVNVVGRVKDRGVDWFVIDDGTWFTDLPKGTGVKVWYPHGTPPDLQSYVQVTGISAIEQNGQTFRRLVKARKNSDVVIRLPGIP